MTSQDATLFEDTFTIDTINAEKYDRVSRLTMVSEDASTAMSLDVNTELYPCLRGEKLQILLATSLSLDGSKDEKGWRDVAKVGSDSEPTLADMYDYVCHGKLYKFEEAEDNNLKAFVSFGGLLMCLEGGYKKLTPLRVEYLYLLIKK
ncbi:hypothetical protein BJ878DRAFT_533396 [Calycina marina]|uniref:DNA-directed RNA polymerases I, II, and III subunit RPABC3 n=1 Tax=Calycina marina TaxID=1763456 RepID=A0A9P7Z6L0_9HELO|nr:hypothetical protein BJ878DRAFT_533396 [Calycina marina]